MIGLHKSSKHAMRNVAFLESVYWLEDFFQDPLYSVNESLIVEND